MDSRGLEPLTPSLQMRCSSQLSYEPNARKNAILTFYVLNQWLKEFVGMRDYASCVRNRLSALHNVYCPEQKLYYNRGKLQLQVSVCEQFQTAPNK